MSKYIIELDENAKEVVVISLEDGDMWTETMEVEDLEQLNSDYINEHFGDLQDTAYQKGFEDGKAQREHDDKIEVGDEVIDKDGDKTIVTHIHGELFDGLCHDGSTMSDLFLEDVDRILEAMKHD